VAESQARKELARQLQSENPGWEVVHPHAAGIDVGNSGSLRGGEARPIPQPVRRLSASPPISSVANWLQSCGCRPWPYSRRDVLDSAVRQSGKSAGSRFISSTHGTPRPAGTESDVQESHVVAEITTPTVAEQLVPTTFKNSDSCAPTGGSGYNVTGAATCVQRMQKARPR